MNYNEMLFPLHSNLVYSHLNKGEQVCFSVDMLRDHQNHKVMQSLTYGPIFFIYIIM